jgi:hypothetical protein
MTTLKIPIFIPDPFELTLIGFANEQPHARMGLTLPVDHLPDILRRHGMLCKERLCLVRGCELTPEVSAQGWLCEQHAKAMRQPPRSH